MVRAAAAEIYDGGSACFDQADGERDAPQDIAHEEQYPDLGRRTRISGDILEGNQDLPTAAKSRAQSFSHAATGLQPLVTAEAVASSSEPSRVSKALEDMVDDD